MKALKIFSIKTIVLSILLFSISCSSNQALFVPYSSDQISYLGRIDTSLVNGVGLLWSGTTIHLNFKGESLFAELKDEKGDNYYNVIIDSDTPFIIRPDTIKHMYQLATGLTKGTHTVEIFKRTEWTRGKTMFYGFRLKGKPEVLPQSKPRKRKIEFYGNSITAGYAVEDTSGQDRPDSTLTNNYLSYAAITARHFDAEYQCICRSGIGVMISWFPQIMPEMYNRLIPDDSTSRWDFSLYTPGIVVINLFQNDSWLVNMPEREQFKVRFGNTAPDDNYIINAYARFVRSIRKEYPEAKIICMLGSMDATQEGSKWPGYIEHAVKQLNDPEIYTHFIPYKGTEGHPSIKEQQEMANSLIQFVDDNIEW